MAINLGKPGLYICLFGPLAGAMDIRAAELDRGKTRCILKDGKTHVRLLRSPAPVRITAELAWVDTRGESEDTKSFEFDIPSGESFHEVPLGLPSFRRPSAQSALRLRYTILAGGGLSTQGIAAFPVLADYAFDIWTISNYRIQPGKPILIRTRTLHPLTRRPVAEVSVIATINGADKTQSVQLADVVTGTDGYALIAGTVPPDFGDDVDVSLAFQKGDLAIRSSISDESEDSSQIRITKDKPLHQPGQTVHLRILALGENGMPLRDKPVEFGISDAEGTLIFESKTITTRFGIAAARVGRCPNPPGTACLAAGGRQFHKFPLQATPAHASQIRFLPGLGLLQSRP